MKRGLMMIAVAASLSLTFTAPASAAKSCNGTANSDYGPQYYGSTQSMIEWFGGRIKALWQKNNCEPI